MPTLVTTKPVPNTEVDANVLANNFTAIENIINGALDETNVASGLVYSPSKIKQGGATTGQVLKWNGSAWAPANQSIGGAVFFHAPQSSTLTGNCFWTTTALTNYDLGHWEFVKDVDGKLNGTVKAAGGETTVTLTIGANATTGVSRLSLGYALVANTESVNVTFTSVTAQDITVPATARLRKDVTFTITAPDAGDIVVLQVYHEGLHANDTLAVNTELYGAWLS